MKKNSTANSGSETLSKHEIRDGQSIPLLQELHILTRDGKLNQDSRRKLKQVYHLFQFIEPLLSQVVTQRGHVTLADHGAGKSYLGFILYDLFAKLAGQPATIYGIETREELVHKSAELAERLGFQHMKFLNLSVAESIDSPELPAKIDIVTALHACNTATDDAIRFGIAKDADYLVLVPCCQAEVAATLKHNRKRNLANPFLRELWHHPLHARELGSHLTNVLRTLLLESKGYSVTVTELIGWEHSMKNELIIAKNRRKPSSEAATKLRQLLLEFGLEELEERFAY